MRNMCETCGEAGEFSRGKSISYLTAFLRNLKDRWDEKALASDTTQNNLGRFRQAGQKEGGAR